MIAATVTGNIGKPAEVRETKSGPVCSFSVASNEGTGDRKTTTWTRCSLWGKRGEALVQRLGSGTKVAVSGSLSLREYEGKQYLELRVNDIDLMGSAGGKKDGGYKPSSAREDEFADEATGSTDDDPIPF